MGIIILRYIKNCILYTQKKYKIHGKWRIDYDRKV